MLTGSSARAYTYRLFARSALARTDAPMVPHRFEFWLQPCDMRRQDFRQRPALFDRAADFAVRRYNLQNYSGACALRIVRRCNFRRRALHSAH
jgi:hypothetical protein